MNKQIFVTVGLLIFVAVILAVSLRGLPGNPSSEELNENRWKDDGPLELSPDRGRYALTYSLIENRSFQFSLPLARFATPDLAISDGQYVSLFAPGISMLIIPGYLIGKAAGAAQVGAFAVITLFALFNVVLLRSIAIRLGAHPLAASLASLAFIFASPAFTYAVTLYQHHVSVFLILLGVYVLLRWNSLWSVSLIWFLWAAAVIVDSPNLFLLLPIGLAALGQLVYFHRHNSRLYLTIRYAGVLTFFAALLPIIFFLWVNQMSYGDPLQLAGTLPRVQVIEADGLPAASDVLPESVSVSRRDSNKEKTAVGFFQTRNMLNGFYVHALSPDRGVLWFAPVVLLGIFGLAFADRDKARVGALLVSIIGVNVILYSMWGDPWGGWAFGSRYLIPTYAMLAIGLAVALSRWRARPVLLLIFLAVFGYSAWVNTLGAITSSTNPPRVEVLALEETTGQEEKYTYERNWDYLVDSGSKSFIWQAAAKEYISAQNYHLLLTSVIVLAAGALTAGLALAGYRSGKETL